MTQTITGLLGSLLLVGSLLALYLVTKSKRVEKSIETLGALVDTLTKGNTSLREEAIYREHQHQAERTFDKAECDAALNAEREARRLEHLACSEKIAQLQGKVDVLTTNIADVIATAVVAAVSMRTAVQGPAHNQGDTSA